MNNNKGGIDNEKICCLFLIFALLFPVTPMVFATDTFVTDTAITETASYVELETGDSIRLEAIKVTSSAALHKKLSLGVYTTRIFRNNLLEEVLYVDFANDTLRHEYPNGSVVTEALSDVVTISKVEPSTDDQSLELFLSTSTEGAPRADYILEETFTILPSGVQATFPGQPSYGGYQAMGYRGGYFYAPTKYCYLQRKNAGVEGTYYSHRFEFSAGTKIGTAASVIVAFFTSSGVPGLILSLAVSLLGAIIDLVTYDWSTVFEVKCYEWQYRIRLSSDLGLIIGTNYRTRDFWRSYSPATGEASYEYRGTAYDGGFLLSNIEMINFALDSYLQSLHQ